MPAAPSTETMEADEIVDSPPFGVRWTFSGDGWTDAGPQPWIIGRGSDRVRIDVEWVSNERPFDDMYDWSNCELRYGDHPVLVLTADGLQMTIEPTGIVVTGDPHPVAGMALLLLGFRVKTCERVAPERHELIGAYNSLPERAQRYAPNIHALLAERTRHDARRVR
jgi:hypothetical protein